ncbi:Hypp5496 [Branchiostoma lanceolatum]|uniref:Hypp5496 protein n=1 Tax=Branchiostoma lanceolatum TaxID=7740 RepID=A0A8J9W262_BRALA|nr:Hypp5496 [Branchiostoma lanceolatum]
MADIYEDACRVNPSSFLDQKGTTLNLTSDEDGKAELSGSESDDDNTAPDIDDQHDYIPGVGMKPAGHDQTEDRPWPLLNVISVILLLLICCLLAVVVSMCLAVQQSIDQGQEKMGKVTKMEQMLTNELSIILEHHENLTNQMSLQMMSQEAMMKKLSVILQTQENITKGWGQQLKKLSPVGVQDGQIKTLSRAIISEFQRQMMAKSRWFG